MTVFDTLIFGWPRLVFSAADTNAGGGDAGAGGNPPPGGEGGEGGDAGGEGGEGGGEGGGDDFSWFGEEVDTDTKRYLESKKFDKPADLYKSLRAAEKMIRGDQLPGPPEDPEKQAEWMKSSGLAKRLGVPEAPTDYPVKPPEFDDDVKGMIAYDDTRHTRLLEQAHKLNLTPAQVEGVLGFYRDEMTADAQTYTTEAQADEAKMKAELGREWGDSYDQNLQAALEVAKESGLDETQIEALRVGQVAGSTALTKILHELAVVRGNDGLKGGGKGGGVADKATAQAELDAHNAKYGKALVDRDHPEHQWALDKMQELKAKAGRGTAGQG